MFYDYRMTEEKTTFYESWTAKNNKGWHKIGHLLGVKKDIGWKRKTSIAFKSYYEDELELHFSKNYFCPKIILNSLKIPVVILKSAVSPIFKH